MNEHEIIEICMWNDSENKLEGDYMMTDILNMKDCDLNKG